MTDFRIAVLIDADNISHQYAAALLEELTQFGRTTVKRAYADWSGENMKGWKAKLNLHAIAPVQTFAYTTGKNSTDSALIIDAMDLLYSGNVDAFAIVSSDSDFTRLANRLRESGKTVYGVGRERTARALQEACDQFIRLEMLDIPPEEKPPVTAAKDTEVTAQPEPERPNLQSLLTRAVNNAAGETGQANLPALGTAIRRLYSAFTPKEYGYGGLLAMVEGEPYLTVSGSGSGVSVSQKGKTPARKAPAKKAAARKTAAKKAAQSSG